MSGKFLKGIFLIFGFCFFLQTIWMIGANFGLAEPFCVVVGKNSLKCMPDGKIKSVAKQFCLGKSPFGEKYKKSQLQQTDSLLPPFAQAQQNAAGYPAQGLITQDQLKAQQQFLMQQQQLQAQRQAAQQGQTQAVTPQADDSDNDDDE